MVNYFDCKKVMVGDGDVTLPRIIGYMFLTNPELVPLDAKKWIENENIWLQRASDIVSTKI